MARFLLVLLLAACGGSELQWPEVKAQIRERFPEVEHLTTAELGAWLADPGRQQPLLFDTRTKEEFAISHLRGAHLVDSKEKALALLTGKRRNFPVIAYCSVGYRSAVMARRLRNAGYTRVFNLEGSIFQWANEGRPLEPRQVVHPYDETWGVLLRRDLWADTGQ